jgi:multicomponent Na+:H+ antiporter subunit E
MSARSALGRGTLLFGFWIVLMGVGALNAVVGAVTAAAATLVSLWLLPPQAARLRVTALPGLALRFLRQSLVAGLDVARRAFSPALPMRLGYAQYAVGFRPGRGRNAFAALTSLLPGTVPAGEDAESLLYHCLDVNQPVVEQLAAEEAVLRRALKEVAP